MKNTIQTLIQRAFVVLLLCSFSLVASAQSKTVKQFSETAEGYNLYLYQSMIRMLNKDKNPEFNSLIKDLDHLRFVTTDSTGLAAKQVFKELDKGIQSEGFEDVMSVDNKDFKCHFYQLGADGTEATWVGVLFGMGQAGIIEMKGSIDLQHMDAMQSVDLEDLKSILGSPLTDKEAWD